MEYTIKSNEYFEEELKNIKNIKENILHVDINNYNIEYCIKQLKNFNKVKLMLTIDYIKDSKDSSNLNVLHLVNDTIKEIPNITDLTILENDLRKFPETICELKQLEHLYIVCSLKETIQTLPNNFSQLNNLLTLDLSFSNFKIFPEIICELKQLEYICFINNKLKVLPKTFNNLQNLKELDVSGNNFLIFPKVICELKNLEKLSIEHNGTKFDILPLSITKLINLKTLYIECSFNYDNVNNFIKYIYNMHNLVYFYGCGKDFETCIINGKNTFYESKKIGKNFEFLITQSLHTKNNFLYKFLKKNNSYKIIKNILSFSEIPTIRKRNKSIIQEE